MSVRTRPYPDIDGTSEVTAFEIGRDYMTLQFNDGSTYRHTYASAG